MIKPLRNGVLLRPSEASQSKIAGIILTASVSNEAVVVETGPDVKELKVGDRVRFDTQSVAKVDSYLLCREADVLCVVE